ncbi:hypothetical protein CPC16_011516 [Podila verticillata]|nr:hypothetical protein CPC16_011516 [Podila verticillata]
MLDLSVPDTVVQTILEGCSDPKEFELKAGDLCKASHGLDSIFLTDTAFLTDTRIHDMDRISHWRAEWINLQPTLESGLDELARCSEMEEVGFSFIVHDMGVSELEWMEQHWSKMKECRSMFPPTSSKARSAGVTRRKQIRENEDLESYMWDKLHPRAETQD